MHINARDREKNLPEARRRQETDAHPAAAARKAAERELEKQYKARKIAEAKSALGAAMIEYLSALDMVIDDKTYADVDLIIEALPQIKVIKSGGRWF